MLYRVTCSDGSIYFYDNAKNQIFDSVFKKINIAELVSLKKESFKKFNGFPKGKVRQLRKLKIQLGLKCNMNCSYCQQAASRQASKDESVADYQGLIQQLREQRIEVNNGKIEFWGGEPFVYLKTLQKLIPELRELYPSADFSIVTNGTLITPKLVDWLIEQRVSLTVSHDAQGYELKDNNNPIDDPKLRAFWLYAQENLRKAGLDFGFNVVITKKNCDLMEISNYFRTKFSEHAQFNFEGIVEAMSPDDLINEDEFDLLRASVARALIEGEGFETLQSTANRVIRILASEIPNSALRAKCEAPNQDVLVVDLKGNVLSCQNFTSQFVKIGELSKFEEINSNQFVHYLDKKLCQTCLMSSFCKGACPLRQPTLCRNDFYFWFSIFNAVWILMFGKQIVNMELYDKSDN